MGIPSGYDITRDLIFEYTRLPDNVMRWRHWKLFQDDEVLVSAFYDSDLPRPMVVGEELISESVIHGISYNFWDQWYNVVTVYDGELEFKGYYSDILTPIQKSWNLVTMTDLFLDFFMFPDGTWAIKDEDEFQEGVEKGYMDEDIVSHARETLDYIMSRAEANDWPPEVVTRIPRDPIRELKAVRRLEMP